MTSATLPSRGQTQSCLSCGHPRDVHEHHRSGSDCGRCPCPNFVRDGLLNRLLAGLPLRRRGGFL